MVLWMRWIVLRNSSAVVLVLIRVKFWEDMWWVRFLQEISHHVWLVIRDSSWFLEYWFSTDVKYLGNWWVERLCQVSHHLGWTFWTIYWLGFVKKFSLVQPILTTFGNWFGEAKFPYGAIFFWYLIFLAENRTIYIPCKRKEDHHFLFAITLSGWGVFRPDCHWPLVLVVGLGVCPHGYVLGLSVHSNW